MRFILAFLLLAGTALSADGSAQLSPDALKFFETDVRPLLALHCYKCHGAEKQKGGLRLDHVSTMLSGGESGAAVVPGKPDESLLIEAVNYESFEMPPAGKLSEKQIAVLTKWVKIGAPWPASDAPVPARDVESAKITDEDREHWAFQPVRDPDVPKREDDWGRNEIDAFVLLRLRNESLLPADQASREVLIRRLTFDLTGLPPTPVEIQEFLADKSPSAYETLVERLLGSPRYGERWARHWLDLVRYAESDGFRADFYRENAWRYRDYVVRSFNDDKPYNQFLREQVAGDEIAPDDPDAIIATGFLRHWIYEYNQRDARTQWDDILNDVTDVTGDVFLGMGMGCARCHDHKFDPILQKDYYRLRAYFAAMLPRDDVPVASAAELAAHAKRTAAWEEKTREIRAKLDEIEASYHKQAERGAIIKFPPDIQAIMDKPPAERLPLERQLADLVQRQVIYDVERIKYKAEDQKQRDVLLQQLRQHQAEKPKALPLAMSVSDSGGGVPVMHIPGKTKAGDIPPGPLSVLDEAAAVIPKLKGDTTGRRTALADWLADPKNPLTPRVIVNRVWQQHFGKGLVRTASDFGRLGEPPTHPELLDWLTSRFLENGWKLKPLHRLIVMSAAYRQASTSTMSERAMLTDPGNRLLWRMPVRRLDAEQIRDAMLSVSGELNLKAGGAPVSSTSPRRSVYTKVMRNSPDAMIAAFDGAPGFSSTAKRNVTTTPTQALLLINGEWATNRATAMAKRLLRETTGDATLVDRAYLLSYGRLPNARQRTNAVEFLSGTETRIDAELKPTRLTLGAISGREGHAVSISNDSKTPVTVPNSTTLPEGDFTIEAVILLKSLYQDATVRTIVSQWDGNNKHPGWSFGVTSTKSAYKPRNLILQLVGKQGYEVIASNLRPELGKPYYAGCSVKLGDTGPAGVTFFLQDLSRKDAPMQTANVKHRVTQGHRSAEPLVIGGRAKSDRHRWDGLLDDVRLSIRALDREQLWIQNPQPHTSTVGFWRFEQGRECVDSSEYNNAISASKQNARLSAVADLCHVLLNSNEFLYVD